MKLVKKIKTVAKFIPKRIKEVSFEEIRENILKYYDGKWSNFAKDYIACGIGESLISAPIWAFLETWGSKLSSEVLPFVHSYGVEFSKIQREGWVLANLALLGYVSHKGRSAFRWFFKYDDSHELVDGLGHKKTVSGHDGKLGLLVGTLTSGAGYLLGKKLGLHQVASQTGLAPIGTYSAGVSNGIANDFMQECVGLSHPKRVPGWIKNLSQSKKYALAGLMVFSSFTLVNEIYNSYNANFGLNTPIKQELNQKSLEKITLNESFPEFKNFSMRDYVTPVDGVRVDTQKYLTKSKL